MAPYRSLPYAVVWWSVLAPVCRLALLCGVVLLALWGLLRIIEETPLLPAAWHQQEYERRLAYWRLDQVKRELAEMRLSTCPAPESSLKTVKTRR